jgi:CubicO group peptidase (beta-lactamase class C family)
MKILNASFRKIIFCLLIFSAFAFLTEFADCEQPKTREYWPTSGWKTSTPEMQGMDSAKLSIAEEFIQNRLPDAYSLLVVKNGYLVFEKYYRSGNPERVATVHSVTKSVTSALIGIALDQGYLSRVDQKMIEFFPEYVTSELDPRKKEISLKHLLMMSAGFKWNDWGPILFDWYLSSDWGEFTIQLPLENNPGDKFNYNSSVSHLLSIILSQSTEDSSLDFAKKNLFEPLGIQSAFWHQDPQGYTIGGFGLGLSARDLAKIGFLYLNNGYWNGQSIVPEHWVKESTRQWMFVNSVYGPTGYGYQWWIKAVDGCGSYRAWGRRGQFITVVPKLDLVIVVTSETQQPHPPTSVHYSPLFDLVASSVKRERPPKIPLTAVVLPPDVKAFIARYNQALFDMDVVNIADLISDGFLNDGINKQMFINFLTATISYISKSSIILIQFEPEGDIVKIESVMQDKYFETRFMPGSMLIKENDQWKWYGNQTP